MTTPVEPDASEPDAPLSADELQADIERTREQGGAAKVDAVRARGGEAATRAKNAATDGQGKPKTGLLAGAALAAVLLAVAAAVVLRRRR